MPKMNPNQKFHEHVQSVIEEMGIEEMGIADPQVALSAKARAKLAEFSYLFASPTYDLSARVVFRDAGFTDDSVKINVEQIFKFLSPGTEVKTI